MSDYKDVFRTKESQNWCKCWTAVYITRNGLVKFVKDQIDTFQQNLIKNFQPGSLCTTCTTHNVVQCPIPHICRVRRGMCSFHTGPISQIGPCKPHDSFRQSIETQHRFKTPSWNNTCAEKWFTCSWELAKCFMPREGYLDKTTVEDTDFNGIVSVILNYKDFQNYFVDDLSKKSNICTKARDVVNKVRHFQHMKIQVSDTELEDYLDTLNDLLDDKKCLQSNPEATNARKQIDLLRKDELAITKNDIIKILEKAKSELDERTSAIVTTVDDKKEMTLQEIGQEKEESLQQMHQEKEKSIQEIHNEKGNFLQEMCDEKKGALQQIESNKLKTLKDMQAEVSTLLGTVKMAMADTENEKSNAIEETARKEKAKIQHDIHKETKAHIKALEAFGNSIENDLKQSFQEEKERAEASITDAIERGIKDVNQIVTAKLQQLQSIEENKKQTTIENEAETMKNTASTAEASNTKILYSRKSIAPANGSNKCQTKTSEQDAIISEISTGLESKDNEKLKPKPESSVKQQEQGYNEIKTALKESLINFYVERRITLPISPLVPEIDAKLFTFYVPPQLEKRNMSTPTNDGLPFQTYKELFEEDSKPARNIYIEGEPGSGKSAFCSKLVMDWCKINGSQFNDVETADDADQASVDAIHPESDEDIENDYAENTNASESDRESDSSTIFISDPWEHYQVPDCSFEAEDVCFLKQYEFLFFISLRNARGHDCDIDDMIKNQIILELSGSHIFSDMQIDSLLSKEKCLVVLDGLDEWVHPHNSCKRPQSTKSIPHRKSRTNWTLITTTRPWKMTEVRIKNSEIDSLSTLTGISDTQTKCLIDKVVKWLNKSYSRQKSSKIFLEVLERKGIGDLKQIPIVLMQLICLWYEDKRLGNSKCDIYGNMVDMLLQNAKERSENLFKYRNSSTDSCESERQSVIPTCFQNKTFCEMNTRLLASLSSLAFHTLFADDKNESIVFGNTIVEKYMAKEDILFALESGILSSQKVFGSFTRRLSTFCFLHKTFQEFLAAVHFSSTNAVGKQLLQSKFKEDLDFMSISDFFIFTCGLHPERASEISNLIMESVGFLTRNLDYTENDLHDAVSRAQKIILSGYSEAIGNNTKVYLNLQHIILDGTSTDSEIHQILKVNQTANQIKTLIVNTDKRCDLAMDLLQNPNVQLNYLSVSRVCKLHYSRRPCNPVAKLDLASCQKLERISLVGDYFDAEWQIYLEMVKGSSNLQTLRICSNNDLRILMLNLPVISVNITRLELFLKETKYCLDVDLSNCRRLQSLVLVAKQTPVGQLLLNTTNLRELSVDAGYTAYVSVMLALFENPPKLLSQVILKCHDGELFNTVCPSLCSLKELIIEDGRFEFQHIDLHMFNHLQTIDLSDATLIGCAITVPTRMSLTSVTISRSYLENCKLVLPLEANIISTELIRLPKSLQTVEFDMVELSTDALEHVINCVLQCEQAISFTFYQTEYHDTYTWILEYLDSLDLQKTNTEQIMFGGVYETYTYRLVRDGQVKEIIVREFYNF